MRAQPRAAWSTWGTLAVAVFGMLVLKWPSLAAYWVQTRHVPVPFDPPPAVGRLAAAFDERSRAVREAVRQSLADRDTAIVRAANEAVFRTESKRVATQVATLSEEVGRLREALLDLEGQYATAEADRRQALEAASAPAPEAPAATTAPAQTLAAAPVRSKESAIAAGASISATELPAMSGERILFAGDSLMQGVAPHIRRSLCSGGGAHCVDLSKPSSGLSQRWFHDWPRTIAQTLERERFTVLIVFLGANDPWDMIDGARRIAFHSDVWRETYAERVRDIMRTARSSGTSVYWVGLPSMRVPRLHEGTFVQNRIFASVVQEEGGVFIPTRELLGDGADGFNRFLRLAGGREVAVRAEDGVHFTLTGQKLIADAVLASLRTGAAVIARQ
jgi:hypothetical protein